MKAGKLDIEEIEFSVNNVIESVASDVLPTTEEKGIQFTYAIEEGVCEHWLGDPVRIKQILLNLVSNSVKFTASGEVYIEARAIKEDGRVAGLQFVVKDTGIGMSPETVASVFERFSQADTSTTRKFGGTGLGMAITLSLVELMKGSINVESELGSGTEFVVKLPFKAIVNPTAKTQDQEVVCPDLTGCTIVVADDNAINRVIFDKVLSPSNATVVEASNGKEAVEAVLTHKPNLVFMDIQMPVMDGVSAFQSLRKQGCEQPIIAFTANVLEQDIEHYMQLGFTDCVSKLIDISKVYEILTQLKAQSPSWNGESEKEKLLLIG